MMSPTAASAISSVRLFHITRKRLISFSVFSEHFDLATIFWAFRLLLLITSSKKRIAFRSEWASTRLNNQMTHDTIAATKACVNLETNISTKSKSYFVFISEFWIKWVFARFLGKSKEAEIKRINKELANIRSKFKGDKTLDGYQKKKYVCKLLFIFLLGHDIDFGHMEAVNLLSSNKYSEKQIVSADSFSYPTCFQFRF